MVKTLFSYVNNKDLDMALATENTSALSPMDASKK